MKPPRWECRNEADQERLIKFTIEKLDELIEQRYLASVTEHDIWINIAETFPENIAKQEEFHRAQIKRRRIDRAMQRGDSAAVAQLVHQSPELLEYVKQEQQKRNAQPKRGKGRRKGDRRGSDFSFSEAEILPWASEQLDLIREVWRRAYGRSNRGEQDAPTALDIITRRFRPHDPQAAIDHFRARLLSWRSKFPSRLRTPCP